MQRIATEIAAKAAGAVHMADSGVYLEKISAFAALLRHEGLIIGNRETQDACRVLMQFGMEDRLLMKTALRTVLAKSREEQNVFDRAFDSFFISAEAFAQRLEQQKMREDAFQEARRQADEELYLNGEPMELSDEQRDTYAAMSEASRDRLRKFMGTYKEAAARSPELYNNFIHSVFAKVILEEQMRMEDAGQGCQEVDPDFGLMYRDISRFKDTEIPRAISMIQAISQRINGELSAKRKNEGHSGKLDFRRTIRKALETGGSLNRLQFKRKRRRRKHLVMLCDVSGSMMQFSEFALRFVQSLNHVSESSRVFLFSEELFEADAFSLQNMDMFKDYVRKSGLYGRGTDLGTALDALCSQKLQALNASTTLMILSDAKTIDQSRAMRGLQNAKRLAGRVIWLNPIPEQKWRHLKSTQAFASVCSMLSCSTLGALAAACRKLAD